MNDDCSAADRCSYWQDSKCTCICEGERPYGMPICDIEEISINDDVEITKEGMEEFLIAFNNAIKKRK